MLTRTSIAWGSAIFLAAALFGCGSSDEPAIAETESASPNALWETAELLRRDLAIERHPSDGAGRAWLENGSGSPESIVAGTRGTWTILYEAGPLGVAEGGTVFLQVSPFWGWSPPQLFGPNLPGYTTVSTDAPGVTLEPSIPDQYVLAIRIGGRSLREGEEVRIVYGDGPAGAMADRYAESDSRLWIAVDGDGDGVRAPLVDSPGVEILAGPPAAVQLTLPSTARPGETVRLTLAVLDAVGNAGRRIEGEFVLSDVPAGLDLPATIRLTASDLGRKTVEGVVEEEGVYRVRVAGPGNLAGESNPMQVSGSHGRILWGDLQIHSGLSDGSGTPEDIFAYARDVAALDVAALTDHDHWGMLPLARYPSLWREIREATARFHEPGRFVTLLGYEYTSWVHGHRHVLFPGDAGEVFSSVEPDFDHPVKLWDALRPTGALTITHHTAGDPVAANWSIPPDPDLETLTEIVSVHGTSEARDCPAPVSRAIEGNFARDALDLGYRLGFLGSGDGHDGHPGLTRLTSRTGGLAAILAEESTREAVFDALRKRRVYATSGSRIILRATLGDRPMGSIVPAPKGPLDLRVSVIGTTEVRRVDLVRGGKAQRLVRWPGYEVSTGARITGLLSGEYLYVRVIQVDGGMAWSSPFFIK